MRGFCYSECLHKEYHVNSHTQDCKAAITKHISKVRSGQKWRTWQGDKPVYLTRNRFPTDKSRGTSPPLPPRPSQTPIAKPTPPFKKAEIPTKNENDMGIHPLHQSDASKIKQYIAGKKINFTTLDPGNNNQGIDSITKAHIDIPIR